MPAKNVIGHYGRLNTAIDDIWLPVMGNQIVHMGLDADGKPVPVPGGKPCKACTVSHAAMVAASAAAGAKNPKNNCASHVKHIGVGHGLYVRHDVVSDVQAMPHANVFDVAGTVVFGVFSPCRSRRGHHGRV